MNQSQLDGFRHPGKPTDRLFFAAFPDAAAARRIVDVAGALKTAHHLRGKPLCQDRVHVTLHHLGDHPGLPQELVVAARGAAERVRSGAFDVAFDRVSSFSGRPRNCPLILRCGEGSATSLFALQSQLGGRMQETGLGRWVEPGFTPHVTLLYADRRVTAREIEPVAWRVREFALVHSLLGRTEHRVLGRWPLRDSG